MIDTINYYTVPEQSGRFYDTSYLKGLPPDVVYTFGSNSRGRHGAGAALFAAENFGAQEGVAEGPTGRCYAIPTRNHLGPRQLTTRSLEEIQESVTKFLMYARDRYYMRFFITPIGTGHAGYNNEQIASLFKDLPSNCCVSHVWLDYIPHKHANLALEL